MQQISHGLGFGQVLVFLLQFSLDLVYLGSCVSQIAAGVAEIAPEQNAEDRQHQHHHDRREGKPPRAQTTDCIALRRSPFKTRFRGNGAQQALARPCRRLRARGRKRQQRHIRAQGFQFTTAIAAGAQVRLQRGQSLRVIERAHGVERQGLSVLWMHAHANTFLRASKPVRMRVLTVPSGSPVLPAISECVMPSKNAISSALRWSCGRPPSMTRILSTTSFWEAASSRLTPVEIGSSSISSSGGRLRKRSIARLREITASHGASLPRSASKACGLRHNCRNTSCTTSSAAAVLVSTRSATPYTTPA